MQYLEITQHTQINHITALSRIEEDKFVRMDRFTIRSLELVAPMQEDGSSLLNVIDRTVTAMGGRMLRRWLVFPLKGVKPINERLDIVEYFFKEPEFRQLLDDQLHRISDLERIISKVAVGRVSPREVVQLKNALEAIKPIKVACQLLDDQLHRISDLERIISKVAVGRVSPREVVQLKNALEAIKPIKVACQHATNEALKRVGEQLNVCETLKDRIAREIQPDPPQLVNKGDVIADGFNAELDDLRAISRHGKDYLLKIQEREIEKTGISSLKVGYNNVFGYYLEVRELDDLRAISRHGKDYLLKIQEREIEKTGISSLKVGYNNVFGYYLEVRNTFKDKVPEEWIRKQTLAQAERYITQELKEYEEKILGADEKILVLEAQLFNELIAAMQEYIPQIQINANLIARMDCLLSFAKISDENRYVRPIVDDSEVLDIKQGRHPVIETQLPLGERYVPNDVLLDTEKQQIMMITGPNMAGKSALLRQTALIVLLAQVGCFVPAESARVGLVDKIFTRVGASDNISLGESTFMVEMTEAANILNNVSPRSLVLFDELGRGTSTYDGISIAWAIVEYLHEHKKAQARTLFATHYHELNEMEKNFPRIKNFNVSVREVDGKVIFLRKLEPGGSEHSFGIHVAEIAGMPRSIVNRANVILKQLEDDNAGVGGAGKPNVQHIDEPKDGVQLSFFQLDDPVLTQIRDEILGLDVNNLTPVEALNKLNDIKKILLGR